jgi:hypothetical protein
MIIRLAIEDSKALEQIRARYTPAAAPSAPSKTAPKPASPPVETGHVVEARFDSPPRALPALELAVTPHPHARAG